MLEGNCFVDQHRYLADRLCDRDAVDLLEATLPQYAVGHVGGLYLATDHQKLTAFEVGARHCSDDVRQSWPRRYQGKGPTAIAGFIIVLCGNSGCDLVDDRSAWYAPADALYQVHDVAPSDKETTVVSELDQPFGYMITEFH